MHSLEIPKKANKLIESMLDKNQDWCFESLLDIIFSLLKEVAASIQSKAQDEERSTAETKTIDHLFQNFVPFIRLLNLEFDTAIVDRASQCLLTLLQLYAINTDSKKKQLYF